MRKLRLDLDEVRVESFVTAGAAGGAGTVHGHLYTIGCPVDTDPEQCHEPVTDPELSFYNECITLDFPGIGRMTCVPD